MTRPIILLAALAGLAIAAGLYLRSDGSGPSASAQADGSSARIHLRDAAGNPVGEVKLTEEDGTVLVRATVHGLAPGFHGFHVHSKGECIAPFTSAGGHRGHDPAGTHHPNHPADMPVLLVNADGSGEARFKTDRFEIAGLFDADGSALIIHAKPDNYANIPLGAGAKDYTPNSDNPADSNTATGSTAATGNAGDRVACGIVEGD
ncbi:MAG TPA: superoxide dismutase family protein [Dehalococcoidia bacterium]|nr:superoxide dismutase family protein [Dehalococcoidia bacterium]